MRQLILDTETTGLEHQQGHRIIEIGCVELIDRRLTGNNYQVYLNPERDIDEGAQQVHGLSSEFLADKPVFAEIAEEFLGYVRDTEIIIHNAPFDVGFINAELERLDVQNKLENIATIFDTLTFARKKHPGQRNTLDALCKRYVVDNSNRTLHGALLDSEILADVYLAMTGGQMALSLDNTQSASSQNPDSQVTHDHQRAKPTRVIHCTEQELQAHQAYLLEMEQKNSTKPLWNQ
ncbi:MAG: DNA polymerase III subunit epsilon [Gammaproteobacteria bacterium]|nr:DNA polymerase III subunit epsilon [Gammaproteobacteria bacterium]